MAWHDETLAELARQLTYSPAEKRAVQLEAAGRLLGEVDAGKSYPWEYVLFWITGYRPKAAVELTLDGAELKADLSRLIEMLSDSLSLHVAEAGQRVMSVEEVRGEFGVSAKTIQRWRRQGLMAQRFVYADGRKRIGFLQSTVEEFARANRQRVRSAGKFKQMTERERELIIRWGRRLAMRHGCTLKEITRRIGERTGRSAEAIRYTIRKHDRENPEAAVFAAAGEMMGEADRQTILETFDRGVSVEAIATRYGRTRSSIYRVVSQERAARIKLLDIDYVTNPLFEHPEADEIILRVLPAEALERARATVAAGANGKAGDMLVARVPGGLTPYLEEIFRQPVMPTEVEVDAFRRMNYLKFKAAKLQAELEPAMATSSDVAEIESLLTQARGIKNLIVQGNLRVAVHVARRHQQIGSGMGRHAELMELVSDGAVWLMRAAEKFDFARNVKFSTYASYAIMKNFARDRGDQLTRKDRHLVTGQEEVLERVGTRETVGVCEQVDALVTNTKLAALVEQLPERERELLTIHYGLDPARPAMSLSELGAKLGITKARVRQIEVKALRKLRRLMERRVGAAAVAAT